MGHEVPVSGNKFKTEIEIVKRDQTVPILLVDLNFTVHNELGTNEMDNIMETLVYCYYLISQHKLPQLTCTLSDSVNWHVFTCTCSPHSKGLEIIEYFKFHTPSSKEKFDSLYSLLNHIIS